MGFIQQLGEAATGEIGSVVGQGLGMVLGAIGGKAAARANDRRQIEQQKKLQALQIQGQKEMADYNYTKQMNMWDATNYSAQKAQLEKAGLNPGLIYGMSGGGATTTGGGYSAGVGGGNAPSGGGEIQAMLGMGLQLQLMKAQKENIEADTANKEANTAKTSGIDTTKAQAETDNLLQ